MNAIEQTAEGWRVMDGDAVLSTHERLSDALDAALPSVATTKTARLRNPDTGDLNGEWRWLPASDEDSEPLKGALLDAESLRELAMSLNARPSPIAIDGGPTPPGMLPSEVHGTAYTGGGTPANGWAHYALVARSLSGMHELLVWSELVPTVARELDAGRVATGSIHFDATHIDASNGAARGMVFRSHALTNDPADVSLEPANAPRRRTSTLSGRTLRSGVSGAPIMTKPSTRGASADALAKLFALFAIPADDDDAMYKLSDAVYALKETAKAEKAAEAINGGGAPAPDAAPAEARSATRAEMAPEEAMAWQTKALTTLADIFGTPDADAATLLDALVAASEKIKGALAAAPPETVAAKDAPVDGGKTPDEKGPAPEARTAGERAGLEALRSEMASLRSENVRMTNELVGLAPVLKAHKRSKAAEAVDADAKKRARGLAGASREAMIDAHLHSPEAYAAAWAVFDAPPVGSVMRTESGKADPVSITAGDVRSAIDARAAEIGKADPTIAPHVRVSMATKQLRAERPELFDN